MTLLPTKENFTQGRLPILGRNWGLTKNIPFPNRYIQMLPQYKGWIFLEEGAIALKGKWRTVFGNPDAPLDVELGCGNGFFFGQQIQSFPQRNLLALELKYKPLVQTVRRAKVKTMNNGRGVRFHAGYIDLIFEQGEVSNFYIYFPDPWPKKRQNKNRLLNCSFFSKLHALQRPGGFVEIKTDSLDYYDFLLKEFPGSGYKVLRESRDLHSSPWAGENFVTSFERIFSRKNLPIYYLRLVKP